MRVFGTVAEYNPFHFGHAYQIRRMREAGAEGVVAVMSGNFVQRASAAVIDKFTRAESAVANGVDLVIELPVSYSVASAEKFAMGGIYLLDALGCVDTFAFGSETGDLQLFSETAELLCGEQMHREIKAELSGGVSYAKARFSVLKKHGVFAPEEPNDILAVEYLKSLNKLGSAIKPFVIKREKSFMGATEIRRMMTSGISDLSSLLPKSVADSFFQLKDEGLAPADLANAERAMLHFFRNASASEISRCQGMTEGLENRIISVSKKARNLEELYMLVKTKRYALSAVRRAVFCAFANIEKSDALPPYIRVLALNETGRKILRTAKKTAKLPVMTLFSPDLENNPVFLPFIHNEVNAGNIYSLCTPFAGCADGDRTRKIHIQ